MDGLAAWLAAAPACTRMTPSPPPRPRHREARLAVLGLLVTIVVSVAASLALASGRPVTVTDLARRADVVVVGRVAHAESGWDATRTTIATTVEVVVDETWKGGVTEDRVQVRHPGGRADGVESVVAEAPAFAPGERVLLFLARTPDDRLRVLWLWQGKFSVERDGGEDLAVRRAPGTRAVVDRIPLARVREIVTARP